MPKSDSLVRASSGQRGPAGRSKRDCEEVSRLEHDLLAARQAAKLAQAEADSLAEALRAKIQSGAKTTIFALSAVTRETVAWRDIALTLKRVAGVSDDAWADLCATHTRSTNYLQLARK